jgi:hypothetical protein
MSGDGQAGQQFRTSTEPQLANLETRSIPLNRPARFTFDEGRIADFIFMHQSILWHLVLMQLDGGKAGTAR